MFPAKPIAWFLARCVLVYALLIVPWPGLMDGYRALFRGVGNVVSGAIGGQARVTFQPLSDRDYTKDTELVLYNRYNYGSRGRMNITATYTGYRPTAFLIALALAAPTPWSRRWRALLWGLLLVNVFIAFCVWLRILDAFSGGNEIAVYTFSPFWKNLLQTVIKILAISPATAYIAPLFIWILVTFRRGDWSLLASPQKSKH